MNDAETITKRNRLNTKVKSVTFSRVKCFLDFS